MRWRKGSSDKFTAKIKVKIVKMNDMHIAR